MEKKNLKQVNIWKQENSAETILAETNEIKRKETAMKENDYENEYDMYEDLTDEEIDDLFRPKRTNSAKDMAPFFIGKILENETSVGNGMTKTAIEERLKESPYEITVGRGTVDRVINGLTDSGFGYFYKRGQGAWYDPDRKWASNY